jgi:disulfide bond formation protein DsbB
MIYFLILGICIAANFAALSFQFFYHELPCPLCLLQRFGFLSIALGALLNLTYGNSWKYKLIIIISSLFTFVIGLRQVLIHITPNDPGYGSEFLGLHFYTWSAIVSFAVITLMSISFMVNFILNAMFDLERKKGSRIVSLVNVSRIILLGIASLNTILVIFECGYGLCPSDPSTYMSIESAKEVFNEYLSKK